MLDFDLEDSGEAVLVEDACDVGGPRREFFRILLEDIPLSSSLLCGKILFAFIYFLSWVNSLVQFWRVDSGRYRYEILQLFA